nr:MAG TPA: hypothetical protein [Caudoviricetes sp.]DAT69672.1 MAG TPA: hypothetical protein [Caudoviricetes sp.]
MTKTAIPNDISLRYNFAKCKNRNLLVPIHAQYSLMLGVNRHQKSD